MAKAYIAFGSNIGDRIKTIQNAFELINNNPDISIKKMSSYYEAEPVEYPNQAWFINGVIEIETKLTPEELLSFCLEIESEIERIRTIKWGPRTIDLDIIYYDQELISTSDLQIPHLRMHARAFVLLPLAEIAEDFRHPILNRTAQEMYEMMMNTSLVRKIEKEKEKEVQPV